MPTERIENLWDNIVEQIKQNPLMWGGMAVLALVTMFIVLSSGDTVQATDARSLRREKEAEEIRLEEESLAAMRQREAMRLAAVRHQIQNTINIGLNALHLLDKIDTEIELWGEKIEPLLSNRDGKALSAEDNYIVRFIDLFEGVERPNKDHIAHKRRQIEALLQEPKARLEDDTITTGAPPELVKALREHLTWTRKTATSFQAPRESILSLLYEAKKRNPEPDGPTLKAAIADFKGREEAVLADRETQRINRMKLVIEAEKDAQANAIADEKVNQIKFDTAHKVAQMQQEGDTRRVRERALSKATLWTFGVFLGKGRSKFYFHRAVGGISWRKSNRRNSPPFLLSVSYMAKEHILGSPIRFGRAACGDGPDRPGASWPCPTTDEAVEFLKKRLVEFRRYARVWIKEGLIAG